MKRFATALAVLTIILSAGAFRAEASSREGLRMSVAPQTHAPMSRMAQAWGNVCRNGGYWCVNGFAGPIGAPCCGCGFCGWWSAW